MAEVKITVSKNGFYKVEGPVDLVDSEGRPIETREGKPFYLCRCGRSANKPFCDSSHKTLEWDGALAERTG
jgi:CDGSH-type Zn-finger protein